MPVDVGPDTMPDDGAVGAAKRGVYALYKHGVCALYVYVLYIACTSLHPPIPGKGNGSVDADSICCDPA